eukprot:GSA25T00021438001.1
MFNNMLDHEEVSPWRLWRMVSSFRQLLPVKKKRKDGQEETSGDGHQASSALDAYLGELMQKLWRDIKERILGKRSVRRAVRKLINGFLNSCTMSLACSTPYSSCLTRSSSTTKNQPVLIYNYDYGLAEVVRQFVSANEKLQESSNAFHGGQGLQRWQPYASSFFCNLDDKQMADLKRGWDLNLTGSRSGQGERGFWAGERSRVDVQRFHRLFRYCWDYQILRELKNSGHRARNLPLPDSAVLLPHQRQLSREEEQREEEQRLADEQEMREEEQRRRADGIQTREVVEEDDRLGVDEISDEMEEDELADPDNVDVDHMDISTPAAAKASGDAAIIRDGAEDAEMEMLPLQEEQEPEGEPPGSPDQALSAVSPPKNAATTGDDAAVEMKVLEATASLLVVNEGGEGESEGGEEKVDDDVQMQESSKLGPGSPDKKQDDKNAEVDTWKEDEKRTTSPGNTTSLVLSKNNKTAKDVEKCNDEQARAGTTAAPTLLQVASSMASDQGNNNKVTSSTAVALREAFFHMNMFGLWTSFLNRVPDREDLCNLEILDELIAEAKSGSSGEAGLTGEEGSKDASTGQQTTSQAGVPNSCIQSPAVVESIAKDALLRCLASALSAGKDDGEVDVNGSKDKAADGVTIEEVQGELELDDEGASFPPLKRRKIGDQNDGYNAAASQVQVLQQEKNTPETSTTTDLMKRSILNDLEESHKSSAATLRLTPAEEALQSLLWMGLENADFKAKISHLHTSFDSLLETKQHQKLGSSAKNNKETVVDATAAGAGAASAAKTNSTTSSSSTTSLQRLDLSPQHIARETVKQLPHFQRRQICEFVYSHWAMNPERYGRPPLGPGLCVPGNVPVFEYILSKHPDWRAAGNPLWQCGMCHRYDTGTAGPLLYCKTLYGKEVSNMNIEMARMGKDYLALVHGSFSSDLTHGCITYPIDCLIAKDMHDGFGARGGENAIEEKCDPKGWGYASKLEPYRQGVVRSEVDWQVLKRHVRNRGGVLADYNSVTHYEVIQQFCYRERYYSLVHCRILSGRTHQIRVHLRAIGHPLVHDEKYATLTQEIKTPELQKKNGIFQGEWDMRDLNPTLEIQLHKYRNLFLASDTRFHSVESEPASAFHTLLSKLTPMGDDDYKRIEVYARKVSRSLPLLGRCADMRHPDEDFFLNLDDALRSSYFREDEASGTILRDIILEDPQQGEQTPLAEKGKQEVLVEGSAAGTSTNPSTDGARNEPSSAVDNDGGEALGSEFGCFKQDAEAEKAEQEKQQQQPQREPSLKELGKLAEGARKFAAATKNPERKAIFQKMIDAYEKKKSDIQKAIERMKAEEEKKEEEKRLLQEKKEKEAREARERKEEARELEKKQRELQNLLRDLERQDREAQKQKKEEAARAEADVKKEEENKKTDEDAQTISRDTAGRGRDRDAAAGASSRTTEYSVGASLPRYGRNVPLTIIPGNRAARAEAKKASSTSNAAASDEDDMDLPFLSVSSTAGPPSAAPAPASARPREEPRRVEELDPPYIERRAEHSTSRSQYDYIGRAEDSSAAYVARGRDQHQDAPYRAHDRQERDEAVLPPGQSTTDKAALSNALYLRELEEEFARLNAEKNRLLEKTLAQREDRALLSSRANSTSLDDTNYLGKDIQGTRGAGRGEVYGDRERERLVREEPLGPLREPPRHGADVEILRGTNNSNRQSFEDFPSRDDDYISRPPRTEVILEGAKKITLLENERNLSARDPAGVYASTGVAASTVSSATPRVGVLLKERVDVERDLHLGRQGERDLREPLMAGNSSSVRNRDASSALVNDILKDIELEELELSSREQLQRSSSYSVGGPAASRAPYAANGRRDSRARAASYTSSSQIIRVGDTSANEQSSGKAPVLIENESTSSRKAEQELSREVLQVGRGDAALPAPSRSRAVSPSGSVRSGVDALRGECNRSRSFAPDVISRSGSFPAAGGGKGLELERHGSSISNVGTPRGEPPLLQKLSSGLTTGRTPRSQRVSTESSRRPVIDSGLGRPSDLSSKENLNITTRGDTSSNQLYGTTRTESTRDQHDYVDRAPLLGPPAIPPLLPRTRSGAESVRSGVYETRSRRDSGSSYRSIKERDVNLMGPPAIARGAAGYNQESSNRSTYGGRAGRRDSIRSDARSEIRAGEQDLYGAPRDRGGLGGTSGARYAESSITPTSARLYEPSTSRGDHLYNRREDERYSASGTPASSYGGGRGYGAVSESGRYAQSDNRVDQRSGAIQTNSIYPGDTRQAPRGEQLGLYNSRSGRSPGAESVRSVAESLRSHSFVDAYSRGAPPGGATNRSRTVQDEDDLLIEKMLRGKAGVSSSGIQAGAVVDSMSSRRGLDSMRSMDPSRGGLDSVRSMGSARGMDSTRSMNPSRTGMDSVRSMGSSRGGLDSAREGVGRYNYGDESRGQYPSHQGSTPARGGDQHLLDPPSSRSLRYASHSCAPMRHPQLDQRGTRYDQNYPSSVTPRGSMMLPQATSGSGAGRMASTARGGPMEDKRSMTAYDRIIEKYRGASSSVSMARGVNYRADEILDDIRRGEAGGNSTSSRFAADRYLRGYSVMPDRGGSVMPDRGQRRR